MTRQAPAPRIEGDSERRLRRWGYVCVRCDQCVAYPIAEVGHGLVHDGPCPAPR